MNIISTAKLEQVSTDITTSAEVKQKSDAIAVEEVTTLYFTVKKTWDTFNDFETNDNVELWAQLNTLRCICKY